VKILGCTLTLERYSSAAPSEDSESSAVQGCSVVVFGVTGDIDVEDELVPLLENKKKGGGPVEKSERLSQTDDAVLITFVDQSRTKLVLFVARANDTVYNITDWAVGVRCGEARNLKFGRHIDHEGP